MSNSKVLTILIPVYNGADYLAGLLQSFAAYIGEGDNGRDFLDACEILVINNRSEDKTLEVARSFEKQISILRVITPTTHVPSAEENVFRAFEWAQGEFTWVLGCDDIVRFEAIPEVLQVARDGTYDIGIFNFMQSDQNGKLETVCNYYMKDRSFEGDLVELTQRMGFWWLIAGFSGKIVRTRLVVGFDHAGLIARTSPIYSHVTAYLECFAGRRAAIVNVQSVIYRLTDTDIGHWRRAAAKFGVFDEFFWTLGYIRQIAHLEKKGIVRRDFLTKMIESNRRTFFRPTAVIYDKLLYQLQLMNSLVKKKPDNRNCVSRRDFEELVQFLEQRDLLARPFLLAIREIYESLSRKQFVNKLEFDRARRRLESYQSSYLLAELFVGVEGDYEVYRISNTLYAVHRYFRPALVDRLRYLGKTQQPPVVFSAATRSELAYLISKEGIGTDWSGVPGALMRFWSDPTPVLAPDVDSPTAYEQTLFAARRELTTVYKSRKRHLLRFAAWFTVLGLKLSRWLAAKDRRRSLRKNATAPAT